MDGALVQPGLFGDEVEHPAVKPPDTSAEKRVLITVTTAPNPSEKHGEAVCVAGIELGDTGPKNWVRLYPINSRYLRGGGEGFRKYEVITARCHPAKGDSRVESWNPDVSTVKVAGKVTGWDKREPSVEPLATDTMCDLYQAVKADPAARSLGLARPVEITGLDLEDHPGWSEVEQRKVAK